MKRITMLSNLVELLENGAITIETVKNHVTASSDVTDIQDIKSNDFVESIQFLNEAKYFRDAVDFFYEFKDGKLYLDVGLKNPYMDQKYIAVCSIKDGLTFKEIDTKLRETIFDRIAG